MLLQIQTILGLEEAFPMLRIYSRISEQTLYDGCHWYDWVRGSKKLERREAHIDGWKNREDIDQLLEGDDVRWCLKMSFIANTIPVSLPVQKSQ